MLRIDETSNTLVAPQEGGFVAEAPPARADLLHLLASGWQAFAAEIDQKHVTYLAHTLEPGVDLLAFDRSGGRIVVVLVGDHGRELLGRAVLAGAVVAGWTADELAASHKDLSAAVPGESPRIILIAPEWDDPTLNAVEWLDRKHQLELKAYKVGSMRFGSEKLLTLDPAVQTTAEATAPSDPAADFFAHISGQAEPEGEGEAPEAPEAPGDPASTPPPVPAS